MIKSSTAPKCDCRHRLELPRLKSRILEAGASTVRSLAFRSISWLDGDEFVWSWGQCGTVHETESYHSLVFWPRAPLILGASCQLSQTKRRCLGLC